MTNVSKYNLCKSISTVLTAGAPLITFVCSGDLFIHRSDTAISAAGIFAILILAIIFKDKLAEKWKTPSAFILSSAVLVLLILVEKILLPVKYICIATMVSTGIDELTFKRMYTQAEVLLPQSAQAFKKLGFIMCKQSTIDKTSVIGGNK